MNVVTAPAPVLPDARLRSPRTAGGHARASSSRAFSSEVETGSRQENASDASGAFSSEVETGSRQENASDKTSGASLPI
jgi:hypothetical protein